MKDITENNKIVSIKKHGRNVRHGCTGCESCRCRCRGWVPGWSVRSVNHFCVKQGQVLF